MEAAEYVDYEGPDDPYNHVHEDGRASVAQIYEAMDTLVAKGLLKKELIAQQPIQMGPGQLTTSCLPIYGYTTIHNEPLDEEVLGVCLAGGVHGEEPAGPTMFAQSPDAIEVLIKRGIPLVIIPLMSPGTYYRNWRYPDAETGFYLGTNEYSRAAPQFFKERGVETMESPGNSITDADAFLPRLDGDAACVDTRRPEPEYQTTEAIYRWTLRTGQSHKVKLMMDHHEFDDCDHNHTPEGDGKIYVYASGRVDGGFAVCRKITDILVANGCERQESGTNANHERVESGVVRIVNDGSFEDFYTTDDVIFDGQRMPGIRAHSVCCVETRTNDLSVDQRAQQHRALVERVPELLEIIKSMPESTD